MLSNRVLCLVGLMALSTAVRAGTCEDSFEAIGDPRNGLMFVADVQLPGLSVSSALGQLQQITRDKNYEVGNELMKGDNGQLKFMRTDKKTRIVFDALAAPSGKVVLGTKLARDQKMEVEEARQEICSILAALKTGKEGEAIAAAARKQSGGIIDAEAPKLSAEIAAEIKQTLRPVQSKGALGRALIGSGTSATAGEYDEALAPIVAKYQGRKYRIDGQIYTRSRNQFNGHMEIAYLVTQNRGLLGVRESASNNNMNFTIVCRLAPDQDNFFITLTEGDWVKLEGTVDHIDPKGMRLQECRQAKAS